MVCVSPTISVLFEKIKRIMIEFTWKSSARERELSKDLARIQVSKYKS